MPTPREAASAILDEVAPLIAAYSAETAAETGAEFLDGRISEALTLLEQVADEDGASVRGRACYLRGLLLLHGSETGFIPVGSRQYQQTLRSAILSFEMANAERVSAQAYRDSALCWAALGKYDEARLALVSAAAIAEERGEAELVTDIVQVTERVAAQAAQAKRGGCYIATACYGSYDHPDVLIFRRWRDERLLRSYAGRLLVRAYYRVSPALAARLVRVPWLSQGIRRRLLEPWARLLQ